MNSTQHTEIKTTDHSTKRILARGCDPAMSLHASRAIPPLVGNPEYVPTTDDADFIHKLKTEKWSVIFFAPGACRYNAAYRPIPGSNVDTRSWGLEEYKQLIYDLQGEEIKIVEAMDESQTVSLLKKALDEA